jgi:hypothetical protein
VWSFDELSRRVDQTSSLEELKNNIRFVQEARREEQITQAQYQNLLRRLLTNPEFDPSRFGLDFLTRTLDLISCHPLFPLWMLGPERSDLTFVVHTAHAEALMKLFRHLTTYQPVRLYLQQLSPCFARMPTRSPHEYPEAWQGRRRYRAEPPFERIDLASFVMNTGSTDSTARSFWSIDYIRRAPSLIELWADHTRAMTALRQAYERETPSAPWKNERLEMWRGIFAA